MRWGEALSVVDLDAYFARIGYDGPRTPDLATLRALHALHPAAIPFEAIDALLGLNIDISPEAVDAKLIHGRRGGYCFEQNGLFLRVLTALGFDVHGLAGRVRWDRADPELRPRTHMVLRVEIEGQSWLADVGFGGCVLTAPLRLAPGEEQVTDHDIYRLLPIREGVTLEVRRDGAWSPAYDLSLEPCVPADYEMANWYTSTFPTSRFCNVLLAARTTPQARYGLLLNSFTTRPAGGGETVRETLDVAGLERVLSETFGLPVTPEWRPMLERAVEAGGG